ncbi:hypothetical protein FB567DRAFT_590829 [Paraphoma chrysanthemicola]|uniref:Uncharacterized protein n=1 Tax=Paraphoma chrysanthemicola TaxID=798071 RepID=A0A8K0RAB8_9PLEO|nr:hypothetical protein FB567DRAFT_590829 [Paraphoma chrysanthemicola]
MSGQSNVGNSQVYQADDQRTVPDSQIEEAKKENRFHEGKDNSHLTNDPKDERSIKNKLAAEEKRENEEEELSIDEQRRRQDATLPARAHGNEPSKGAKIDQQIREEEEEELRRKGKLN